MLHRTLTTAAVAALFIGCADSESDSVVVGEVSSRLESWSMALESRDGPALAQHYVQTADVVVMWPGPVPGTDGAESITWAWTVGRRRDPAVRVSGSL